MLNFAWTGPNISQGGTSRGGLDVLVVNLMFKGAKTDISVDLPKNINPARLQQFPFICRRYHETGMELSGRSVKSLPSVTYPKSLCITIEQVHNLTVRAGFFERGQPIGPQVMDSSGIITQQETVLRSDRDVSLEIPEELVLGQRYNLIVSSDDHLSLLARLVKATIAASPLAQGGGKASGEEFRERIGRMGEALREEGEKNIELALRGDFDSASTADVVAHSLRGFIRAGQKMHPEITAPTNTKPAQSASDLDKFSTAELQSRFEAIFKKDKELESQRMRAALAGNVPEMNRILEAETVNGQLLINLAEALQRKGVKPQIPETTSFQSAARVSEELHADALRDIQKNCRMQ